MKSKERGVSPVVGVAFIVILVLALASATFVYVGEIYDTSGTEAEPDIDFEDNALELEDEEEGILIEVAGGEEVEADNVYVSAAGEERPITEVSDNISSGDTLETGDVIGPLTAPEGDKIQILWKQPGESYVLYEIPERAVPVVSSIIADDVTAHDPVDPGDTLEVDYTVPNDGGGELFRS